MTINVNGKAVEAYSLIMKKEFAEEILSGKKKVEFRNYTDYYCSRFFDREAIDRNRKAGLTMFDEGAESEYATTEYIHFHDYNNSWFLDVSIHEIGMFCVDSDDIDEYAPDYPDFENFRADAINFDKLPAEDRPLMFYLALGEIVATNLK